MHRQHVGVREAVERHGFLLRELDDRAHRVVDSGLYAVVRHPFYAVTIGYQICASLVLGSWLSLGVAILVAGMLALRIRVEERYLVRELAGYAAYQRRTPWRLVPGLW